MFSENVLHNRPCGILWGQPNQSLLSPTWDSQSATRDRHLSTKPYRTAKQREVETQTEGRVWGRNAQRRGMPIRVSLGSGRTSSAEEKEYIDYLQEFRYLVGSGTVAPIRADWMKQFLILRGAKYNFLSIYSLAHSIHRYSAIRLHGRENNDKMQRTKLL